MSLTLAEVNDTLQGISLSLSGDMMLFGTGKSTRDHLAEMVQKMKENEALVRGITVDEVFSQSSPDLTLHPETEKIWTEYLSALDDSDEEHEDSVEAKELDEDLPQELVSPVTFGSFSDMLRKNALLRTIFLEGFSKENSDNTSMTEKRVAQFNSLNGAINTISSHEARIRNMQEIDFMFLMANEQNSDLDLESVEVWNRAIREVLEQEK